MTLFLFFCVLAPRGMNEIVFGEIKGDRQKSTDYSEDISSEDYILSLTSSKKKGHMKFMKMVVSETEITG